jgi:anti-sigma factor RsiW
VSDDNDARGEGLVVEELVAYLDGELEPEANRRIERQLSRDLTLRQQLRELQQSWDLLDHLPRADVDESFTQSTVAMVAVHAADEVRRAEATGSRRGRSLLIAAAACAALTFMAAFAATRWWAGRAERQLLRDLPVIENVDEYRYAESIEFLRMLEQEGLFVEGGLDDEL